ncbi:MAG: lyase [Pseudomonadota bacterium]|nr:MAG: lyase [Pseudomonadota bacterium]
MRSIMTALAGLLAVFPALARDPQLSATEIEIREWQVPWEKSRPRDPAVAADGRVWFVGQAADYVAVFDPDEESFTRFDLPEGAGPHTVIVTADQQIWYAGNRDSHLGHLDPDSGEIERVETPEDGAQDPHTFVEDSTGRIWFTAQWGNHVGRYDRKTGDIELVAVPTERARPYGIVVDNADNAWVALFGTNKIARVDAETFELTEIDLPREQARPRRIAWTEDGVWYGDYNQGYLGRYVPGNGSIDEWRLPGGDQSGPYALMADDQGRVWAFETWQDPNRLVGFDPGSESFFAAGTVPSGGGTVRHMWFDDSSSSLWFGTDTNYLGQAVLPRGPSE